MLPRGSGNWCRRRRRMLPIVDWRRSVVLQRCRRGCLRLLSLRCFGRRLVFQMRRGKVFASFALNIVSCKLLSLRGVLPCRPVARPQGLPVALSSPSRTRSPEPHVVGEALADDARTATPPRGAVENVVTSPPVADVRVGTPPRVAEVVGTSAGDVGATTSPTIIDTDPISAVAGGAEDLVRDQPQIDLAPGGPEASGAQVPPSSSSSPRLPRLTINWNHTPW
jgi:hypothetical protein